MCTRVVAGLADDVDDASRKTERSRVWLGQVMINYYYIQVNDWLEFIVASLMSISVESSPAWEVHYGWSIGEATKGPHRLEWRVMNHWRRNFKCCVFYNHKEQLLRWLGLQ